MSFDHKTNKRLVFNLIQAKKEAKKKALELIVYGVIGDNEFYDVNAKRLRETLSENQDLDEIKVRINSIGGSVFAGVSIFNMLEDHPAKVKVIVEGQAASAASIIAMAGHSVMKKGSVIMIHNPWTLAVGDHNYMRKMADELEKVRDRTVAIYKEKTGKTESELRELLDEETLFSAQEALDSGFVDEIEEEEVEVEAAGTETQPALAVNGVEFMAADMGIDLVKKFLKQTKAQRVEQDNSEEEMDITAEMLKKDHSEVVNELVKDAVKAAKDEAAKAERERIKGIEEMAMPGHEALVSKAKYEDPVTPEAFAVSLIKSSKEKGATWAQNRSEELVETVEVGDSGEMSEEEQIKALARKIAGK